MHGNKPFISTSIHPPRCPSSTSLLLAHIDENHGAKIKEGHGTSRSVSLGAEVDGQCRGDHRGLGVGRGIPKTRGTGGVGRGRSEQEQYLKSTFRTLPLP